MPGSPTANSSRFLDIRPGERAPLALAAAWFFCVLAAYYLIRPIREVYGVSFSPAERTRSFGTTLAVMLVAAPLYAALVAAVPRRRLAPAVYGLFILCLIGFRWAAAIHPAEPPMWLRWAFFVWVSVFNLYVVTLFWSTAVAVFSGDQGKRLFGPIAAAGTLGGIAGSQLHKALAVAASPADSLLLSAGLLGIGIALAARLLRLDAPPAPPGRDRSEATWLAVWGGAVDVLRSPYLAGIGLLIALTSVCATAVYLQMLELVAQRIPDAADRGAWFADLNTYQNALTLVGQAVGAGWMMRTVGVGATLALGPVVYFAGFTAIALGYASLPLLGAFDVAQRFAGFAFGVPAREVLFTAVAPDEKYRAKAFADTVLKRAGDFGAAAGFQRMAAAGVSAAGAAWGMLPLAGGLAALSLVLGRMRTRRASHESNAASESQVKT